SPYPIDKPSKGVRERPSKNELTLTLRSPCGHPEVTHDFKMVPDPNALATDPKTGKTIAPSASTIEPVTVTLKDTETVADVVATLKEAGIHDLAHISILSPTFGLGAVRIASGR